MQLPDTDFQPLARLRVGPELRCGALEGGQVEGFEDGSGVEDGHKEGEL